MGNSSKKLSQADLDMLKSTEAATGLDRKALLVGMAFVAENFAILAN